EGSPPNLVGAGRRPDPAARSHDPQAIEVVPVLPGGGAESVVGHDAIDVMVLLHGKADLFHVVLALDTGGGSPHLLDRGQEQPDEYGDDGDDHQELDQREAAPSTHTPSKVQAMGRTTAGWRVVKRVLLSSCARRMQAKSRRNLTQREAQLEDGWARTRSTRNGSR